uniref:GH04404p3 n=1 Tax=Drosophila melanogaster TaxID=7227 RepID=E1JIJ1_DROME|nr:uncharacterized protein Dmel_CG42505 [Drosophila melanogaster]ACZ94890.1 uncharacterized protein Dmel_CG42504 [Drosophila melanogaster]AGK45237.1 GH04404p3 [Drosophila melanogaster]|eukprot:NP_001163593.1 uncharacterized protein Dmel_CG42505 [Drosophila melanogaster]
MNPACRLNLESKECQEWMNEVCAHCAHLLPGVEEAELWDKWWSDELPAPFKSRVNLMSAYDCHKLRKEVARQVTNSRDQEWHEDEGNPVTWTLCQLILLIIVMVSSIIAMVCALKVICESQRRWSGRTKCAPPIKVKQEEKPPPPPADVETPPQKDSCKPAKQPKAFISFGRTTDPRTRFGPYKHQKLLQTASMLPECQPAES